MSRPSSRSSSRVAFQAPPDSAGLPPTSAAEVLAELRALRAAMAEQSAASAVAPAPAAPAAPAARERSTSAASRRAASSSRAASVERPLGGGGAPGGAPFGGGLHPPSLAPAPPATVEGLRRELKRVSDAYLALQRESSAARRAGGAGRARSVGQPGLCCCFRHGLPADRARPAAAQPAGPPIETPIEPRGQPAVRFAQQPLRWEGCAHARLTPLTGAVAHARSCAARRRAGDGGGACAAS